MKNCLVAVGILFSLGVMAAPAEAQVAFGVHANYASDFDLGVGARAQSSLGNFVDAESSLAALTGVLSFDYYFPDCGGADCSYLELNGNVQYPLEMGENFAPYVGGGLNVARASVDLGEFGDGDASNTEIGLNALGGASFDLGGFDVFAEAKIELGGGEQFVLTFGTLLGDA